MQLASTITPGRFEVLNVAVATHTILYTPFFAPYYSREFQDTPFGRVSINIVGSADDARFVGVDKLNGDHFATFCLVLGLADAAICDPTYLIYLADSSNIRKEFKNFQELLTPKTKESLYKPESPIYCEWLEPSDGELTIKQTGAALDGFRALIKSKRIIGGMISKIALAIVCESTLAKKSEVAPFKDEENFGKVSNPTKQAFTNTHVTGLICYERPSTGYIIGNLFANIYGKKIHPALFGDEIDEIQKPEHSHSLAVTCDFVSVDYLTSKEGVVLEGRELIGEISNLAEDDGKSYAFTGILGNSESKRHRESLRALLYGIDRTLFYINRFLDSSDTTGLIRYLKERLFRPNGSHVELYRLLVANTYCRDQIIKWVEDPKNKDFEIDTLVRYYVLRLLRCHGDGPMYSASTAPDLNSLKNLVDLRLPNRAGDSAETVIHPYIEDDLLEDWRKDEKRIVKYDAEASKGGLGVWKTLGLIKAPFWARTDEGTDGLHTRLWGYIGNPLFLILIGTAFIWFEVLSGFLHISGHHVSMHALVEFVCDHGYATEWRSCLMNAAMCVDWLFLAYMAIVFWVLISQARGLIELQKKERFVYRDR